MTWCPGKERGSAVYMKLNFVQHRVLPPHFPGKQQPIFTLKPSSAEELGR